MIVAYAHDGALYDEAVVSSHGFKLDTKRDIKEVAIYDTATGEKTDKKEIIFNFVGFITNKNNDIMVVFPKHYNVSDNETDSRIVFNCIAKHTQKKTDIYIGENNDDKFESNYPFSAFFGIYEYFKNYGLYFEDKTFIKPNTGGRISWKETICKSEKYMIRNNVIMFPLYYRRNYHFSNFITECMIYAIDYTVSKFGVLIDAKETGLNFPEMDYLEEREYVVNILQQLRQYIFKDNVKTLIDNLIMFFEKINKGGEFYLKHYKFSSIWEDMVTNYLRKYYKGVNSNHQLLFDKVSPSKLPFEKKSFHTNRAKPEQYISPDHYCDKLGIQLIFDAKYYSDIRGMNYKQIAYLFMLRDIIDGNTGKKEFNQSHSALILPSDKFNSKIHFQLAPQYGVCNDFIITEEYMDIREVMIEYLS